ncbi:MAG TPA: aldo/keto reductase [Micromonosporaceae bacterium]|jgi:diketogulonate reductase-like aldo/keto reductase
MRVTTTIRLASGVDLPRVGLGTWQMSGRRAYDAIRYALDAGYRHIDTATMYGNEGEVGRALWDSGLPRDEVFLTTKLPAERAGRARDTLDASLRALDVEAVDLWLIHWPTSDRALVATWEALLAARAEGRARAVGVSNFSIAQIDRITVETGEAPALNQVPWSPFHHSADILAAHQERGIVVEGYSPLKRSDLRSPVLAAIATAHGVTPAQVVLRWHLQHDIVVIPKSATPERIDENLGVFGFSLTTDEMSTLDKLSA